MELGKGALEEMVNFWSGRRVFLTGHTGFKGAWLALWLVSRGARVRGFALDPDTDPNLFGVASVADHLEDFRGDIRDGVRLQTVLSDFEPEIVFHLAAQPLVRRSYADPLGTFATNVMGTAHVLDAIRHCPSVRVVVCVTTDKCYENKEWVWPYRETDALGGHDPYASSKACAEIVSAAYRSSFYSAGGAGQHRVALATARAGNVIGGGDWSEDRLIPDLIRGFQDRRDVLIRRPTAIRPWQHVLEPLHGYMLLAQKLMTEDDRFCSAFNFGPADEDCWPVERIANTIVRLWGEGARWVYDIEPGVHESHFLRLDASKARAELGWRPCLRIDTALEWTVDWYKQWRSGADLYACAQSQIAAYEKLLQLFSC